jgi:hypothetical protein
MRRTASQSWAGGSVSFGIGFLGISAGGRTSRESVDVKPRRVLDVLRKPRRFNSSRLRPGSGTRVPW